MSSDGLCIQKDIGNSVALYVPWKCSRSNHINATRDHTSIQMNVAEADRGTGRFNGQFKTYSICRAICKSDDSILPLAKTDRIVSKNF